MERAKVLAFAVACTAAASSPAFADQTSTAQWQEMKAEIELLKK